MASRDPREGSGPPLSPHKARCCVDPAQRRIPGGAPPGAGDTAAAPAAAVHAVHTGASAPRVLTHVPGRGRAVVVVAPSPARSPAAPHRAGLIRGAVPRAPGANAPGGWRPNPQSDPQGGVRPRTVQVPCDTAPGP